jgi:hypothetical protein
MLWIFSWLLGLVADALWEVAVASLCLWLWTNASFGSCGMPSVWL